MDQKLPGEHEHFTPANHTVWCILLSCTPDTQLMAPAVVAGSFVLPVQAVECW